MRSTDEVKYFDFKKSPIIFIGFMGSGKTTVAQILARRLGVRCVELDRAIERRARTSIAVIFTRLGEKRFRQLEAQALLDALDVGQVVSAGGGVVLRASNRGLMRRRRALVVWLDPTWATLWERLKKAGMGRRPLLAGGDAREIRALWEKRKKYYERCATVRLRIPSTERPARTAERLFLKLQPIPKKLKARASK